MPAPRSGSTPARWPADLARGAAAGWCHFDPAAMFPGRTGEGFDFFCRWAFAASGRLPGRKLFACDELQVLVGTAAMPPALALVLETGRRVGLDVAVIAQQPNLVHNRIRNQITEVVTFQQVDPRAIEWCAEVGFDPDAVRALRLGQYLARNLKTGGEAAGRVF